ncbi:MAG TPA: DUF2807 domain-containing protein [Longimicrobiales bacterium]|nr:DUF2807 domain-containing protein [Longimicrobiales bacterium]
MKRRWSRMGVLGAALGLGGCILPLDIDIDTGIHVRGSGRVVSEARFVDAFDAIVASGSIHVVVERTGYEGVTVSAEDNILPYIRTQVHNGVLELSPAPGVSLSPRHEILVYVESYEVVELEASGATSVEADLGWVEDLWVTVSGASSVEVWGAADNAYVTVSGASWYDALDLETLDSRIDVSGASEARIWAREFLGVTASGASRVRFRGNPVVSAQVSGASTVMRW